MRKNKGFTLVELMIVMAVIAILATLALFGLRRAQAAARDAEREAIMRGYQVGLENYYANNGAYPSDANFGAMHSRLYSASPKYIDVPSDPSCPNPPGTGEWIPCASGTPPQYSYGVADGGNCTKAPGTNQDYQLELQRESGGTLYFCSPG